GNIDLAAGHARNTGPAAQHTYRILTLAAGGSNTDIANDHACAVHTRMSVTALTGFLALVAVHTLIQVDHQHLGPFNYAAADQRIQTCTRFCIRDSVDFLKL